MLDYSIFTDLYPLEYKTGDCRFAPIPGYSVLGLFQSQASSVAVGDSYAVIPHKLQILTRT